VYTHLQEFLTLVYGAESLNPNLNWLVEGLGKKDGERLKSVIRGYFFEEIGRAHV
jgi:hypothetical protein